MTADVPPARDALERFVARRTGLELARGGVRRSLERFLERRQRELGVRSLAEYLAYLEQPDSRELERLLDAVTVVHSWFFRDPGQLAAIEALLAEPRADARPLQVWVGGCAGGEDAYSIALLAERAGRPVHILGTDLNSEALARARLGEYGAWSVRDVGPDLRAYFTPTGAAFRVHDRLKQNVRFERHNLIDAPPLPPAGGAWDVILCRNVLIYFVRDEARRVFERQAEALTPGGHILLGASDVVFDVPRTLEARYLAGRLVFRRRTGTTPVPAQPAPRPPIPARHERALVGPLPALPRAASEILESYRPSSASRLRAAAPDPLAQGHLLLDQGDPRAARDAYLGVVAEDGTNASAYMYAGIAHYLCGEIAEALHCLRGALFLDSALWPAAFYLALAYESMGLPGDALREYKNVIRLSARATPPDEAEHPALSAWQHDLLELARLRVAGNTEPIQAKLARRR